MNALFALWWLSLALSGTALAIMSCLVAARAMGFLRGRSREKERRRLLPLILAGETDAASLAKIGPPSDTLTDLAIELVQIMRGTDQANLVAFLTLLGVPDRLRDRLQNGAPRIRATAAEAMLTFADGPSAAVWLTRALDDSNADVRLAAAMALAGSGHAPPARLLIEQLGIGNGENSTRIVSLFREISKERPDEIRSLVEDEGIPDSVRVAAIDALSACRQFSLVPLIVNLAMKADPNSDDLTHYMKALGDFGDPAAACAVEHGLRSAGWRSRAAAAEAAGRIGLRECCGQLVELLGDLEWGVQFRAGEALALLGDEGQRLLREIAASGSDRASIAARLTLAERASLAPKLTLVERACAA